MSETTAKAKPKAKTESTSAVVAGAPRLEYKLNGTKVTITAHTGESNSVYTPEQILSRIELDAAAFPAVFQTGNEDVTKTLVGYGLQKLMQDRTSQITGGPVEKLAGMKAEAERLQAGGPWSELKERAASTPRSKRLDSALVQAVAELQNISLAKAEASLQALTAEQRNTIAANPKVADVVTRIRAEAKDTDAAGLLDGLLG